MKLTGNTIFITGATSGIGRGLAEALHRLGNRVIVAGRRQALLDEVVEACPGMAAIQLDIADSASIERAARTIIRDFPETNVLFNNAGVLLFDDPSGPIDEAAAQRVITTNLLGPIRMTSALIEHLKGRPAATILYTTSILGFVPCATNAVYSATKAALHSYILSQRFQLRDTGIGVQEIVPPWVDTDLIFKSGDPRSMTVDVFVEQAMALLGGDDPEIVVDVAKPLRNNPGPNEHQLLNTFNKYIEKNPLPVGK